MKQLSWSVVCIVLQCMILYMAIGRVFNVIRHSSCLKNQYRFYTTTMTSLLVPPVSVRGMTCLDRDAFTTVVTVSTLKLRDIVISKKIHVLKKYLLKICNFKSVKKISDGAIVYLNPDIVTKFEDITESDRKLLLDEYEYFDRMNITIRYDNWRRDVILKSILPEDIEVPTAYSLVGHIVQLNLRNVQLPYKSIIGQVFLDKTASARTVVNKINTIDTSFRYFAMEILAGERNTITITKEHGCTYQFDFAQVYWNPRLSTEHVRMITFMMQGDVLYDVFAGVGPFAIPAARKKIQVFANDLNPESYKWLQKNAAINKLKDNFKAFNMDGRDFLRKIVRNDILIRRTQDLPGSEHIIMNLPASATEFLDILPDSFTQEELKKVCLKSPIFHIYCFVKANKGDDVCMLGRLLIEQKLGFTLSADSIVSIHDIRDVSPNKQMVRVSFLLKQKTIKGEEPATKKHKINDKKMGKNKRIHKKKNVFKVATVRSIKLKAKAQKVITNLKKFDPKGNKISNKNKTISMDQLLKELDKDLQASNSKAKLDAKLTQKKLIKINKETSVSMTRSQTDNVTALMVKQMQL